MSIACLRFAVVCLTLACCCRAALVADVRSKLSAGDVSSAEAILEAYQESNGSNAEYAAGLAWVARGALNLHDAKAASDDLARLKPLIAQLLEKTKVEDDAFLASAVGASIECEARLLELQGKRDRA